VRIPTSILNAAILISRNLVPVVGVSLLAWSAAKLILIYFVDTVLTFAALFALAVIDIMREPLPPERKGKAWTLAERIGLVGFGSLIFAAVLAFPLGLPLFMFGVLQELSWRGVMDDRELHWALLIQAAFVLWFFAQNYFFAAAQPRARGHLRERFGFAFIRWFIMLLAIYVTTALLPVEWWSPLRWIRGVILIAVYAVATVSLELWPEKVTRFFGLKGGLSGEDPERRTTETPTNDAR
jgi:hypothetical protein